MDMTWIDAVSAPALIALAIAQALALAAQALLARRRAEQAQAEGVNQMQRALTDWATHTDSERAELMRQIEQLRLELSETRLELVELRARKTVLADELARARADVDEHRRQLAALEQQARAAQETISEINAQRQAAEAGWAAEQKLVARQGDEIRTLRRRVGELEHEVARLQGRNEALMQLFAGIQLSVSASPPTPDESNSEDVEKDTEENAI